jgi:hypothetical protein
MEQGPADHRLRALETKMLTMEQKVNDIHEIVTRAKGGWRVLLILGAIITGLAMVINAISAVLGLKH